MTLTQINKAGLDEIALDHVFTIGASGSSAYTFQGEGLNGTVNNPTLYLTRGKTYRFENGSGGHPIRIQSTQGASGTAYNTGVTNNAGSGTVIVEVQHDAPDVLYYQCTSHAAMNGILYITGALADGGVTTAKIADSAITAAKIANGVISADKLAVNAVTTANITDANVTTAKLANNAVNGTILADNSVSSTKIQNNAVTTTKIADSQVTTAKINDQAVTSAKIASDAVHSGKIADDAVGSEHIQDQAITSSLIAPSAVVTAKIADQAVTLDKLPHGTSSNNGKFLRANNGADPTFESIPAGITINNQADNRIITATGTSDTLNSESNLTFALSGSDPILTIQGTSAGHAQLNLNTGGTTDHCGVNFGDSQQTGIGRIQYTNSGDYMILQTNGAERMRIDSSGNVTKSYQPMFQARNSQGAHITINAGVIPFNTVINNVGSHYNNSNYRFTAPVAGVYLFYVGWFVSSDTNHRISLRINGTDFTAPYIAGYSNSMGSSIPTFSGCQFLKLGSNDYVDCYSDSAFYPYGTHVGWGGYLLG